MRIIGGVNKGRNLVGLGKGDLSAHLRPTSDRVRESIFNLIIGGRFGDKLENFLREAKMQKLRFLLANLPLCNNPRLN